MNSPINFKNHRLPSPYTFDEMEYTVSTVYNEVTHSITFEREYYHLKTKDGWTRVWFWKPKGAELDYSRAQRAKPNKKKRIKK